MNLVPESVANASGYRPYERYYMRKIYFVLSYDPTATDQIDVANAGTYKNYYFVEGDRPYIRRETLVENCFIRPGLCSVVEMWTIPIRHSGDCVLSNMSIFASSRPVGTTKV